MYEYTQNEKEMFARKDALTAAKIEEIRSGLPSDPQAQIEYLIGEWRDNSARPNVQTETELYSQPDKTEINNVLIRSLHARGIVTRDSGKTWGDPAKAENDNDGVFDSAGWDVS